MKKQKGSVAGSRLSGVGHQCGLSTDHPSTTLVRLRSPQVRAVCLRFTLLLALLAGTARAATNDWVGTTSTNMSTAANWSPANVPGSADVAHWNAASYGNQPSLTAGLTIGQLLFGEGNSSTVTIGGSSGWALEGQTPRTAKSFSVFRG